MRWAPAVYPYPIGGDDRRLVDTDGRCYFDTTGTATPPIVDSLRYWVTDMHVDGVRFHLAASRARPRGQPGQHRRQPVVELRSRDDNEISWIDWDLADTGSSASAGS